MMPVKLLVIRDADNVIPVMAIRLQSTSALQQSVLAKAGYKPDAREVILVALASAETQVDPRNWRGPRAMKVAHQCIEDSFYELVDGQVIDVGFLLGEVPALIHPRFRSKPK